MILREQFKRAGAGAGAGTGLNGPVDRFTGVINRVSKLVVERAITSRFKP